MFTLSLEFKWENRSWVLADEQERISCDRRSAITNYHLPEKNWLKLTLDDSKGFFGKSK